METESETLNNLFKCFDWNPDLLKLPNLCFYSIIYLHSFFMVWQVLAADVGQGVILPSLQGERKTRCGRKDTEVKIEQGSHPAQLSQERRKPEVETAAEQGAGAAQ